ncbi:protein FAM221A isoform X1 [Lathamus discolor]|uniref:protein FAM221A isoform X1 n=1 Tax=Lathamus discolor TaxID=678569 RepID=UPI0032B743DE
MDRNWELQVASLRSCPKSASFCAELGTKRCPRPDSAVRAGRGGWPPSTPRRLGRSAPAQASGHTAAPQPGPALTCRGQRPPPLSPRPLPAGGPMERLRADAAALDEYAEYRRIVGDDDGGKLFTPEEYEEYKRKVVPIRLRNRLYVSWRSPTGMDCKLVGPETLCFCTHRYKQHKTDYEVIPEDRPICVPCRVSRCPCQSYHYVPLNGTQPIRCRCKHFADQHSAAPEHSCNSWEGQRRVLLMAMDINHSMGNPVRYWEINVCFKGKTVLVQAALRGGICILRGSKCLGFHSCFTCACGQPTYAHETVVETKEERLAQGKPVGRDVPYAAMGGLTGFSSLAEGYMRLDDSGIGAPPAELLESPVTSMDHPFLKAFQGPSTSAQTIPQIAGGSSGTRQVYPGKDSEQDDMAYFEKRYQERLKNEKAAKQKEKSAVPSKKP